MIQETWCVNCGLLLTDRYGVSKKRAVFDTSLPGWHYTHEHKNGEEIEVVWARCEECNGFAHVRLDAYKATNDN